MATEGVTVTAPPATYRRREHPNPELEAGVELKLGAFQHVPSLSVPEARLVISKIFDMRKQTGGGDASGAGGGGYAHAIMENEILLRTQDYLEAFSRFEDKDSLEVVEQRLNQRAQLESFERSQLANLCCDSADEAKALIPSLSTKLSDEELTTLLDELKQLRNFNE